MAAHSTQQGIASRAALHRVEGRAEASNARGCCAWQTERKGAQEGAASRNRTR
jgi:hypothetical protein